MEAGPTHLVASHTGQCRSAPWACWCSPRALSSHLPLWGSRSSTGPTCPQEGGLRQTWGSAQPLPLISCLLASVFSRENGCGYHGKSVHNTGRRGRHSLSAASSRHTVCRPLRILPAPIIIISLPPLNACRMCG